VEPLQKGLIKNEHGSRLHRGPNASGSNASKATPNALAPIDDPETPYDGGSIEGSGAVSGADGGHRRGACVLRLDAGLDNVERGGDDTGHAAGTCSRQNFQGQPDVVGADVMLCQVALLLVKSKLQGGKGQVAPQRGLVSVEEGTEAFCPVDCPRGIEGGAVVVARVEVGVVEAALQLEASLEDLGGHVDGGGGEVGNEACGEVGYRRRDAVVDHQPLAPLVGGEEGAGAQEGAGEGGLDSAIQAATDTFLAPDGVVGVAHGGVLGRHVRISLLSRLDRVQRVHQHVARGAPEAAGQGCLRCSINFGVLCSVETGAYMEIGRARGLVVDVGVGVAGGLQDIRQRPDAFHGNWAALTIVHEAVGNRRSQPVGHAGKSHGRCGAREESKGWVCVGVWVSKNSQGWLGFSCMPRGIRPGSARAAPSRAGFCLHVHAHPALVGPGASIPSPISPPRPRALHSATLALFAGTRSCSRLLDATRPAPTTMSHSWLQRKRKGELLELAQRANIPE